MLNPNQVFADALRRYRNDGEIPLASGGSRHASRAAARQASEAEERPRLRRGATREEISAYRQARGRTAAADLERRLQRDLIRAQTAAAQAQADRPVKGQPTDEQQRMVQALGELQTHMADENFAEAKQVWDALPKADRATLMATPEGQRLYKGLQEGIEKNKPPGQSRASRVDVAREVIRAVEPQFVNSLRHFVRLPGMAVRALLQQQGLERREGETADAYHQRVAAQRQKARRQAAVPRPPAERSKARRGPTVPAGMIDMTALGEWLRERWGGSPPPQAEPPAPADADGQAMPPLVPRRERPDDGEPSRSLNLPSVEDATRGLSERLNTPPESAVPTEAEIEAPDAPASPPPAVRRPPSGWLAGRIDMAKAMDPYKRATETKSKLPPYNHTHHMIVNWAKDARLDNWANELTQWMRTQRNDLEARLRKQGFSLESDKVEIDQWPQAMRRDNETLATLARRLVRVQDLLLEKKFDAAESELNDFQDAQAAFDPSAYSETR